MVMEANKEKFSADMKPEVGMQIQIHHEDGGSIIASITKMAEHIITLDSNHPLAKKALRIDIELADRRARAHLSCSRFSLIQKYIEAVAP